MRLAIGIYGGAVVPVAAAPAPSIIGFTTNNRAFTGTMEAPLPADAVGYLAFLCVTTDVLTGAGLVIPSGWTVVASGAGTNHYWRLCSGTVTSGTTWTVDGWSAAITVVGYDRAVSVLADRTADYTSPQTCPTVTTSAPALVCRWLTGDAYPTVFTQGWPTAAPDSRIWSVSAGDDYAMSVLAHSTQTVAGATGTADWTVPELASNGDGVAHTVAVY